MRGWPYRHWQVCMQGNCIKICFSRHLHILFHRFAFEPETQANSRAERDRIKREIENLEPYNIPDTDIEIDFEVIRTLIDGHTRSMWQEQFTDCSNNCPICGAKPETMGEKDGVFPTHDANLLFGISPLHLRMKCFDW